MRAPGGTERFQRPRTEAVEGVGESVVTTQIRQEFIWILSPCLCFRAGKRKRPFGERGRNQTAFEAGQQLGFIGAT